MPYYAVRKGTITQILQDWPSTQKFMAGLPGGPGYAPTLQKKFNTRNDAEEWLKMNNTKNDDGWVIWTDGSAELNKSAGYGFVITYNNEVKYQGNGRVIGPLTSPYAELCGVLEGLRYFTTKHPATDVTIKTDSKYLVDMFNTHLPRRYPSKDFEGLKYIEVLIPMYEYILQYRREHRLNIEHVSAHVGIRFNEMADRLAHDGRVSH